MWVLLASHGEADVLPRRALVETERSRLLLVTTSQPVLLTSSLGYNDDLLYWQDLLDQLGKSGYQLLVLSAANSDSMVGESVRIRRTPSRRLRLGRRPGTYDRGAMLPNPIAVWRELRQADPSCLVLSEFTPMSALGWLYALGHRRLPVLHLCESDPTIGGRLPLSAAKRQLRRLILRRADMVLTNNEAGHRHVVSMGVSPESVVVAPYLTSDPGKDETSHVVNDGLVRVLVVGSVSERKGCREFVQSLAELAPDLLEQLEVRWVGRIAEPELLPGRETELPIDFVGPVAYDVLGGQYQWADVLVIPTLHDYRSLVGFEALRYGLPIVHSVRDGAAREVTVPNENGYHYDPKVTAELAMALRRLVESAQLRHAFGTASYERSFQYTVHRCATTLGEAITRTTSEKPSRLR